MVATKPVDFRKGAEGLATLVREAMTADPFSGTVYVFRAKRADRIKLIFWDGTGLCLFEKRLEDGIFRWPKMEDGVMRLSGAQWAAPDHQGAAAASLRPHGGNTARGPDVAGSGRRRAGRSVWRSQAGRERARGASDPGSQA